jgi:hypothetical protein
MVLISGHGLKHLSWIQNSLNSINRLSLKATFFESIYYSLDKFSETYQIEESDETRKAKIDQTQKLKTQQK